MNVITTVEELIKVYDDFASDLYNQYSRNGVSIYFREISTRTTPSIHIPTYVADYYQSNIGMIKRDVIKKLGIKLKPDDNEITQSMMSSVCRNYYIDIYFKAENGK